MKLYEISNELNSVLDGAGEDGELTQSEIDYLDSLQQDFEGKAVSLASFIKNLEAEEKAIADAIEDMKSRKSKLTNKVKSLSDYLQYNLQKLSINEIKSSPFFKIKLRQCPVSVDVFDEDSIPSEFWKEKITMTIDKMKLKDVLNEGIEVTGATLQRKIKLEIK